MYPTLLCIIIITAYRVVYFKVKLWKIIQLQPPVKADSVHLQVFNYTCGTTDRSVGPSFVMIIVDVNEAVQLMHKRVYRVSRNAHARRIFASIAYNRLNFITAKLGPFMFPVSTSVTL